MKRSSKTRKIVLLGVLVALLIALMTLASAVWDAERAVEIVPGDIENSTLIIGSHLIHLSAMTETIYDIAQTSAEESGQDRMYYKSELADGTWFDITEATTLADITTAGTPVMEDVIRELLFTHHTKSDGITYDLRTGEPVALHDIRDPYDLESMEELFPLKMQFDTLLESELDTDERREKIFDITTIFATDVNVGETPQYDLWLEALQRYYNVLEQNGGGSSEMEIVQGVMDATDASRRVEVLDLLYDVLTNYAYKLQGIGVPMPESKPVEGEDDEEEEEYSEPSQDTNLQAAVNDSIANISESRIKYDGKKLSEGMTVMTLVQYGEMWDLIYAAEADNHTECDRIVARLLHLKNISNSVIANKEPELEMLDEELIPRATSRYLDGLAAGENAEYRAAVAANSAQVLLNSIANQNTGNVNVFRSELEFFIESKTNRQAVADGISYVRQRLGEAAGYRGSVPGDAFSAGANESIDDHIEFLTRLLQKLQAAAGGSDIDKLMAEKEDLQVDYMSALDKNDLAGAAEIAAQIAEIDEQLQELLGEQDAELKSMQDELDRLRAEDDGSGANDAAIAQLEADIAVKKAGQSDGSLGAMVSELKGNCLANIKDGDTDLLDANLSALAGMLDPNFGLVFPALQEVHDAMVEQRDLSGNGAFDGLIDMVETAILDNKSAYDAAMSDTLSMEDLDQIATDFFDGTGTSLFDMSGLGGDTGAGDLTALLDGISSGERAVVTVMALGMYDDMMNSDAARQLRRAKTQTQINLADPYFFEVIKNTAVEYLPCTAIAAVTNLRYVWHRNLNQGTLAAGLDYYVFTVYSTGVARSRDGDVTDQMTLPAQFLRVVHVPEDYTLEQLGLEAGYVSGTDYGYIISDEIRTLAEALFERFMAATA